MAGMADQTMGQKKPDRRVEAVGMEKVTLHRAPGWALWRDVHVDR